MTGMETTRSLEKQYVLVEHEFEYRSKEGLVIQIKPNERYILLKRTNEHWWHVRLDAQTKPFYIPAKYVKVLPSITRHDVEYEPSKINTEDLKDTESYPQYSYTFLPPEEHLSTTQPNYPLPIITHVQRVSAGNTLQISTNVQEANASSSLPAGNSLPEAANVQHVTGSSPVPPAINVQMVSTSNTVPEPGITPPRANNSMPVIDNSLSRASNSMPAVGNTVPAVGNTLPRASNSMSAIDNNLPIAVVPRVSGGKTLQAAKANRVSFLSLSNDSVVFVQSHEDVQHPEGNSIMRTFHNSKKIPNPDKRISFLCSGDPQTNLRPTQSLNDLEKIISKAPSSDHHKPERAPHGDGTEGKERSRTPGHDEATPAQVITEEEEPVPVPVPVYVNIEELRKERLTRRSDQHSSTSTLEEWETHTDTSTGHPFYYNSLTGETTWDSPFDQSEDQTHSPISSPSQSPLLVESDWERHFDEITRQFYFYNSVSGETSWDPPEEDLDLAAMNPVYSSYRPMEQRPPTPEADYPTYSPDIDTFPEADYLDMPHASISPDYRISDGPSSSWYSQTTNNGKPLYTNSYNSETGFQSEDKYGKPPLYSPDGASSQWSFPPQINQTLDPYRTRSDSDPHSKSPNSYQNARPPETKNLEKAGVLHKTKISEHGKRIRKSWSSSWTVLEGDILTFFKDGKNLSSNSLKSTSSLTTPEHTVRLQGATLGWAKKDKSSKKNVLELKTVDGSEYLIHHDSEAITADWFATISKSISRNTTEHVHDTDTDPFLDSAPHDKLGLKEEKEKKLQGAQSSATVTSEESRNVRAKLKKFLQRRPTLQSLRDKGYIKDQVFGCPLHELCEREKQDVPGFVTKCILAVERRGLDIDGLYRISGNLAIIQKLRYKADHDDNFSLEDGRWEDVHVITGALKLFFRELPEPLFPYSHFDRFLEAIKITEQNQKSRRIKELVESVPTPNLETMRVLFKHLCRVIEHRESNRMSVQSVAIVFGPTLLRPETEGASIAMYMVFQSQIVEQILLQYKYIFNVS
ncbi:rho GTPase-activating protein 27-like [Discoglossus pictus]